jgi:hypothetical protein
MEFSVEDEAFLRDLVKASRQKHHHLKWVDRDGTPRVTVLSQTEIVRLNAIAGRQRIGNAELLRKAGHIPVPKLTGPIVPPAQSGAVAVPAQSVSKERPDVAAE